MLLSEVEYVRPGSVAAAIGILSGHDNARVLAGGQSLVNVMKQRFAAPELVVDLNGISELRAIRGVDGVLELGAMATLDAIDHSAEVRATRPILADVASRIADQQVRNRGTIGGNICLADPTNNFPPLLSALGAELEVAAEGGTRTIPVDDFFVGVYETAVEPGEVLTLVRVPARAPAQGDGWGSLGVGRDGTGIVNVAVTLRLEGGLIAQARISVGCVSFVPLRPIDVEARLAGTAAELDAVRDAVAGLGASLDPPSDVHASAEYRRHVAEVITVRAVMQAIEEARTR